ncbi:MAG: copper resistance protein B, partial [Rickettsiales bacterium]
MHTKLSLFAALLMLLGTTQTALAGDGHGGQIFHGFTLEADYGTGESDPVASWDLDGWIGGDYNKLWLKSEG